MRTDGSVRDAGEDPWRTEDGVLDVDQNHGAQEAEPGLLYSVRSDEKQVQRFNHPTVAEAPGFTPEPVLSISLSAVRPPLSSLIHLSFTVGNNLPPVTYLLSSPTDSHPEPYSFHRVYTVVFIPISEQEVGDVQVCGTTNTHNSPSSFLVLFQFLPQ